MGKRTKRVVFARWKKKLLPHYRMGHWEQLELQVDLDFLLRRTSKREEKKREKNHKSANYFQLNEAKAAAAKKHDKNTYEKCFLLSPAAYWWLIVIRWFLVPSHFVSFFFCELISLKTLSFNIVFDVSQREYCCVCFPFHPSLSLSLSPSLITDGWLSKVFASTEIIHFRY